HRRVARLGVPASFEHQGHGTLAESVGRAASVGSNRKLRPFTFDAQQTSIAIHLVEWADQRRVVTGAERHVDTPGLQLAKRVTARYDTRRAGVVEGVRRTL